MIKWTTPTLKCTIPEGVEYDYIVISLKQGDTLIERTIQASEVVDNSFQIMLTQEETSTLTINSKVEAQLNIVNGSIREATNIVELMVCRNLHEQML